MTWPRLLRAGIFRMCWCGRGAECLSATDYVVDVGELMVVGPPFYPQGSDQHWALRTCISGQHCRTTPGLEDGRALILDTCGHVPNPQIIRSAQ